MRLNRLPSRFKYTNLNCRMRMKEGGRIPASCIYNDSTIVPMNTIKFILHKYHSSPMQLSFNYFRLSGFHGLSNVRSILHSFRFLSYSKTSKLTLHTCLLLQVFSSSEDFRRIITSDLPACRLDAKRDSRLRASAGAQIAMGTSMAVRSRNGT